MTHATHSLDDTPPTRRPWLLAAVVTAALVFGFWGSWLYESGRHPGALPDVFSVLYHSCQLLIAHGVHLEDAVPWQLHVGRLLGVLSLFTAGLVAFTKFFHQEMLLFQLRLPWSHNHVLVCGLGDLGLRLAMDARRRGKFVVAIEKHGEVTPIEQARKAGVLVIEGDACDAPTLRKVRVQRAEFVVASCEHDATNVAIAAIVGQLLRATANRRRPLVCRLMVRDSELRRLLEEGSLFGPGTRSSTTEASNYLVNFRDLTLQDTAARQALRRHPLDFESIGKDDATLVHLVIAGFGPMGQSLALHAARIGHFANGVTRNLRIRITVVDRDAKARSEVFRELYSKIDNVCEFRFHEADRNEPAFLKTLDEKSLDTGDPKVLVTFAVCFETGSTPDDCENLRIGMEIARRVSPSRPVQTLIYQSTRSGFAALFPPDPEPSRNKQRLRAFGMIEDIFTWDTLLHESEDQLARALHEDYARKHPPKDKPAEAWENLPEAMKDSNRHAADHIPTKLRALGYQDAPLELGKVPIEQFKPEEIDLLSQMEHLRWCAERWLDGWEYGPETIREKKINKCLVKWDQVSPEDQKKDHEQIRAIPYVLRGIGRAIYPDGKLAPRVSSGTRMTISAAETPAPSASAIP